MQFKSCSSRDHKPRISVYEKEKVPIEKFLKPGKPNTDLYKMCEDCRVVQRGTRKITEQNKKEKIKKCLESQGTDDRYNVCPYLHHDTVSEHPRDKVPKILFSRYPDDPTYTHKPYKNCLDCRQHSRAKSVRGEKNRKLKIVPEGYFYCTGCRKHKPQSEISTKIIGTGNNTRCKECQEKDNAYNKRHNLELKESYRKIQLEYILKNQSSREICKSIFLMPEPGTQFCIELKTREENNERYLDYKNKTYLVKDFLDEFKNLLELRILDFDHLPENEQREGETYIPKKACVRSMHNEKDMRTEAKKCQLLDCKCHVKITVSRETTDKRYNSGRLKKMEYVNDIKRETGCIICGYLDEDLLRFIEMDHIDPDIKIDCVSHMVLYDNYTLADVIEECEKCRPLCRFCHRIHSSWQIEKGII